MSNSTKSTPDLGPLTLRRPRVFPPRKPYVPPVGSEELMRKQIFDRDPEHKPICYDVDKVARHNSSNRDTMERIITDPDIDANHAACVEASLQAAKQPPSGRCS